MPQAGPGTPAASADGLQLVFDDDLVVELEATEGGALSLAAGVAALGAEGREAVLAELLAANSGRGRHGRRGFRARRGPGRGGVVPALRSVGGFEQEAALEAGLEEFLDTLASWKARFGRGEVGAETAVGRGRTDGLLPDAAAQVIRG